MDNITLEALRAYNQNQEMVEYHARERDNAMKTLLQHIDELEGEIKSLKGED